MNNSMLLLEKKVVVTQVSLLNERVLPFYSQVVRSYMDYCVQV